MSRDPEDGKRLDPASLHKYLYADGDPVNGIDPRGLEEAVEFNLTLIAGGSAGAAVLPELTAGLAQFVAVAQQYVGLAYLTFQDIMTVAAQAQFTQALGRYLACEILGELVIRVLSQDSLDENETAIVALIPGHLCFEFAHNGH
jgi:branched-subunit amino acid transport protein AzlD